MKRIETSGLLQRHERLIEGRAHRRLDRWHRAQRSEHAGVRAIAVATQRLPQRAHVGRCVREEAERVEALRERQDAFHREQAEGRLESCDAAVGRRPEHRALGLGSEGQRHHAGSHRRCRTTRAPAGRVIEVARVSCGRRSDVRKRRRLCLADQTAHRDSSARSRCRRLRPRRVRGRSPSRTRSPCRGCP